MSIKTEDIILDFDESKQVVGFEILHVSIRTSPKDRSSMQFASAWFDDTNSPQSPVQMIHLIMSNTAIFHARENLTRLPLFE